MDLAEPDAKKHPAPDGHPQDRHRRSPPQGSPPLFPGPSEGPSSQPGHLQNITGGHPEQSVTPRLHPSFPPEPRPPRAPGEGGRPSRSEEAPPTVQSPPWGLGRCCRRVTQKSTKPTPEIRERGAASKQCGQEVMFHVDLFSKF